MITKLEGQNGGIGVNIVGGEMNEMAVIEAALAFVGKGWNACM